MTIKDVAHEEDLRRIRPLKVVVPCHGAMNWSSHHGSDREHAPAVHRTLCISVELKRPVFHTNTNLAEAKRERLLGKGQRNIKCHKTRTAEVTICIISERLPDRPRQLPHASSLGTRCQGFKEIHVKKRRSGVFEPTCRPMVHAMKCGAKPYTTNLQPPVHSTERQKKKRVASPGLMKERQFGSIFVQTLCTQTPPYCCSKSHPWTSTLSLFSNFQLGDLNVSCSPLSSSIVSKCANHFLNTEQSRRTTQCHDASADQLRWSRG